MAYPEPDHQIPCIIENGIVYGMKDIYRIVRDMGHVRYSEIVNHEVVTRGEGYIMSVVANQQSATIIANQRLYLNVCGFDYMRISSQDDGNVHFDLVHPYRTLRLTPVPDAGGEDSLENKVQRYDDYDPFEQEDYAEIQLEDDDETMDGD